MSGADLGKVEEGALRTNLVVYHGVTDVFSKTAKFIRILHVVKEPRDIALLYQWL